MTSIRSRLRLRGNPLLVLPYILQQTHMSNFSSLRPMVSAVRCLSVSHSVMEEFYMYWLIGSRLTTVSSDGKQ